MATKFELKGHVSKHNFPDAEGKAHWFFILDEDPTCRINNQFFLDLKEDGIICVFDDVTVETYEELNKLYKKSFASDAAAPAVAKVKALLNK